MRKIADVPLAMMSVSVRPAPPTTNPTRVVVGALGLALVFLAARIVGQI